MTVAKRLTSPRCVERVVAGFEDAPSGATRRDFVLAEQRVAPRLEHVEIGRPLDQHVDDQRHLAPLRGVRRRAAPPTASRKEHEQPDRHDGVVVRHDAVAVEVRSAATSASASRRATACSRAIAAGLASSAVTRSRAGPQLARFPVRSRGRARGAQMRQGPRLEGVEREFPASIWRRNCRSKKSTVRGVHRRQRSARLPSAAQWPRRCGRGRGEPILPAVGQPPADGTSGRQPTGARCNASRIIESIDLRQETLSQLGEHCAIACAARRERKVQ
jgi:hypothetical protein